MSKPPGKERRRRRRVQVALPVSVVVDDSDQETPATVENLSESGVLLKTAAAVEKGRNVRVVFEEGIRARAECTGRVARLDGERGIGVEFNDTAEPLRGFVRRLLVTCRDLHRDALDD